MTECKICRSNVECFTTSSGKEFIICSNCGFIALDASFIVSSNLEKERYDLHQNSIDDAGYVKYLQNFIDFAITPFTNHINTILDYGCGPQPVLADILKSQNYQVYYYDLYYYDNQYLNRKYDMIVTTEVIEHIKDPLDTLKKLLGLLNDDGFIAIMTLFSPDDLFKFDKWWYKDDITHISFFKYQTFKVISKTLNCKIVDTNYKNIIILQKNKSDQML